MEKFTIIGAGSLGRHLSAVLREKGFLKTQKIHKADWIFVTVPDNMLQKVVDEIPSFVHGRIITCSASILVDSENHAIESAHPLQTFPKQPIDTKRFHGIFWAVEPNVSAELLRLICQTGGTHFVIPRESRMLYHIMAIVVSNLLIGLLDYAKSVGEKTTLPEDQIYKILHPLVQSTINNYFENGFSALSGPAKRGDIDLIKQHKEELKVNKISSQIYDSITELLLQNLK